MDDFSAVSAALLDALHKAQMGDVTGAEGDLQSIRSAWLLERSPELMVDLMIVECACAVYTGRMNYARDRVNRAIVVAKLSRQSECIYAASAWSAYISMIEGGIRKAADLIVDGCAVRPDNVSPLAEFRSSSMLAVILEYLGLSADAAFWFERARTLASKIGLPGLYSSTVYNIAVARVSASMLARIRRCESDPKADLDLLATRSAINFDNITNVHVLDPLHKLIEAQAQYLCGRVPQAIGCIESFLVSSKDVPHRFVVRAEFELLRCQIANHVIPAKSDLERLTELLRTFRSDDELALVKHVLSEGYAAAGLINVASTLDDEISSHLRLHQEMSDSISASFGRVGFLRVSGGLV